MPSADFFARLGFFVRRDFLDRDSCERLIAEVNESPREPCLVVRKGVDSVLDQRTRATSSALVPRTTRLRLKQRFVELTSQLEAHFGTPLAGSETPGFLVYETGAFFATHADTGPDDPPEIRARRVSAILFLNGPSGHATDGYSGGTLRFHRVLDGPEWEACPLPFDPEPGTLLAFRSHVVHEVLPVTCGRRLTVVTWFPARDA